MQAAAMSSLEFRGEQLGEQHGTLVGGEPFGARAAAGGG